MLKLNYTNDLNIFEITFCNNDIITYKDDKMTTHHNISLGDRVWVEDFIRSKSIMLLPQIVEVMMTPRYDFNDVKRELVKL